MGPGVRSRGSTQRVLEPGLAQAFARAACERQSPLEFDAFHHAQPESVPAHPTPPAQFLRDLATRTSLVLRWCAFALALGVAACTPFQRAPDTVMRGQSRWVAADWSELPGWEDDTVRQAWPALMRSCGRPAPEWAGLCARARQVAAPYDDAELRKWLMQHLQPYRVETLQGAAQGLITGYYEPTFEGRRLPTWSHRVPLHALPADFAARRPYWTRQQLDILPAAQASVRGREIAYLADPLDALALQIQGSGRLRLTEPDGTARVVRLSYAGTNDHPYRSVGRWLIEQGELPAGQASWPAIREWARRNPAHVQELLWANPRYVFFREETLVDPALGPRGAQGVPLTPGRSIAIDPRTLPYGTPAWIDTTEPMSNRPLRRLVLAQDTGSAIVGPVRADYFWGWEHGAAEQAGRMKQSLRMWVLWPRGANATTSALPAQVTNAVAPSGVKATRIGTPVKSNTPTRARDRASSRTSVPSSRAATQTSRPSGRTAIASVPRPVATLRTAAGSSSDTAVTLPEPMFATNACSPRGATATMCEVSCPVGIAATTLAASGSTINRWREPSVVTASLSAAYHARPCGRVWGAMSMRRTSRGCSRSTMLSVEPGVSRVP